MRTDHTFEYTALAISRFLDSYQDAHQVLDIDRLLWDARTPHLCACACAHAEICVTIDSSV